MAGHKNHCCLVYDYGLFVELAVTLAKDFGRVIYYCPWQDGYPSSDKKMIGIGLKGVERVDELWPYLDEVDLFVFPDVYECGLQQHLRSLGKRVFGCFEGAELELDRVKSKEMSEELGIDIGPYAVLNGIDALRSHLKKNDEQWVKISATRGDMETWRAVNYEMAEQKLNQLAAKLGAKAKIMEFIVEKAIEPAIEVGYDGYTIDGKFAKGAIVGIEVKDKSYVGKAVRYQSLPQTVRSVNENLSPALRRYKYRGLLSTEIRVTDDGKAYLIDPCARAGSPPNEVYQMMIGNLADIMWEGSEGILIEPEYEAKYGAELLITSEEAKENWLPVSFPAQYRDNVKLRNLAIIEGQHYYIPDQSGCSAIGAVVAMADTAEAAMAECRKIAESLEGEGIDVAADSLDKAYADLKQVLKDSDKPKSPKQRQMEELHARGRISDKQLAKRMETA